MAKFGFILLAILLGPAFAPTITFASESYLAIEMRVVEAPRAVVIALPQKQLDADIELGRIAPPGIGGGFLGSMVMQSIDRRPLRLAQSAAEQAELTISPLVRSLEGFDVHALAQNATRSALEQPAWLNAGSFTMLDLSDENERPSASSVASPDAPQTVLFTYLYQLSPDFTQMQVIMSVEMIAANARAPFYEQQILSLVVLERPSFVPEENIARWNAQDGQIARAALAAAFSRLETVIPVVMSLDKQAFKTVTDKRSPSATGGGYHGPVLMRDETGTVLWSQKVGFVAVQRAAE